jgi:uncharacterized protein (DUF302 family)
MNSEKLKQLGLSGVFLMSAAMAAGNGTDATAAPQAATAQAVTTTTVPVAHRSMAIDAAFERFTSALEQILGHFPSGVQQDIIKSPQLAEQRLKAAEGAQGLMIFSVFDHGAALNMLNARRNAKQYLIGNPLTAIQMTQHDIRAALYAPLRVLVYERGDRRTIVEYDQPSSQFGQFAQTDVTQVARTLDEKLERVLVQAADLSR